jgi:cell wall-associated NlpC family hydrolase
VRLRAIGILLGLSLSVAGSGTLMASPAPTTLPGSTPSAAPSQAPGPGEGAAVPVAAPVAAPPVAVSLIAPGTKGSLVVQMQKRLRAKGVKVKVTGTYDRPTQAGVRRLQKSLRLPATGIIDTAFLSAIGVKMRGVAGATRALPSPAANAAVVPELLKYVGVPYKWGGTTPAGGFDCSGLTQYAYRAIGKSVPRTTWDLWAAFPRVPFDQLAPGDMVFFSNLGHMGVYIGDGNFIHAPRTGEFVRVQALSTRLGSYMGAVRA